MRPGAECPSSAVSERACQNARVPGHLRADQDGECCHSQPGPEVGSDPMDPPVGREIEDHRVAEPEASDLGLTAKHGDVAVCDLLPPDESAQAAVHGLEQDPQIVMA